MTTPEPETYDLGVTDHPDVREPCGPRLPDLHDLYSAQDAPLEADRAGCTVAEYNRLVLERQQTELAYLAGIDRRLERALAYEAGPELEAGS